MSISLPKSERSTQKRRHLAGQKTAQDSAIVGEVNRHKKREGNEIPRMGGCFKVAKTTPIRYSFTFLI